VQRVILRIFAALNKSLSPSMRKEYVNTSLHVLLLSIVCVFTFFVNNQTIYPDIMESRNIVTAREMVYDGHWMIPTMDGELRLEKPPLPTWIAAGIEKVLPDNIGAQRAMAGLAASMLVFFFYLFGRRLTESEDFAWISSLVLCTSYSVVLMGRTATWDIYCHAFMMGAIYFIYRTFKDRQHTWRSATMAGLFLGLSFMSKGPISFYGLLLPFLILFLTMEGPMQKHRMGHLLLIIGLCLAISSWWYIYIYVFHSEVTRSVIHKESSAWMGHNVRPWYYYWSFFLETGVWSLMMITALLFPVWMKKMRGQREYLFVLLWIALQLVLLSLMPEKKKRYLLPMLIPCSYLIGMVLTYWKGQLHRHADHLTTVLFDVNTYALSFVCLALPVAGYFFLCRPGYLPMNTFLLISILLICISGWLLVTSWHKEPFFFVYGIVALFFVAEIWAMPYIGDLANNTEMKSIRRTRDIKELDGLPFYYVKGQEMRIEIIYEAHRKILPLDVNNVDSVRKAMPFVLVTHDRAEKILPPSVKKRCSLKWIDCYDDNRRPKGTSMYKELFIYNVTIVKPKVAAPKQGYI
jgi:4-amino-4-deoxy-L-arabinose transferase-like glycosyltransferase